MWKIRAYQQQCKKDITLKVKFVRINDSKRDILGQQGEQKECTRKCNMGLLTETFLQRFAYLSRKINFIGRSEQ
jgi:hypothetical protein